MKLTGLPVSKTKTTIVQNMDTFFHQFEKQHLPNLLRPILQPIRWCHHPLNSPPRNLLQSPMLLGVVVPAVDNYRSNGQCCYIGNKRHGSDASASDNFDVFDALAPVAALPIAAGFLMAPATAIASRRARS